MMPTMDTVAQYFAYGSNMAQEVMSKACPGHRLVSAAELADHRLAFTRRSTRTGTGVSDIVPSIGDAVWGVLYEVDADCFDGLDRKEGVRRGAYERVQITVRVTAGTTCVADAYSVVRKEPVEVPPSPWYLDGLIKAALERDLPDSYVAFLESRRAWAEAAATDAWNPS